ncbi:MAG: sigma-70 family RNA polymerase sigma factor [Deltaproteobacteria bacterium]|nr:sigma-70 family RNA polymerase sigma factor [Deltaproteobacteria bacterium]
MALAMTAPKRDPLHAGDGSPIHRDRSTTPPPRAPADLLARFRDGDPDAFAQIVRLHGGIVRSVAHRRFLNPVDREEAVQEIWLQAFRHRAAVDPSRAASFGGWLYTLADRRCLDLREYQQVRARGSGGQPTDDAVDMATPDAEEQASRRELLSAVQVFKARLQPAWREFFDLYFVQGLEYADIMPRLNIGPLRCRYMRRVLVARARRNRGLLEALDRHLEQRDHAPRP